MLRLQRCSEVLRIVFRSGAVSAAFLTAGLIASPPAAAQGASSILTKPDPLKIIVSLDKQHMYVYRGTEQVFTSRVSTGKRGYSTPAGIYSILEKRRWHRSNIYNNAPMPFMQRLTWSGIALHASGHVPRYPASHGCIRLPRSSASTLFKKTDVGGHVIVTRGDTTPRPIAHGKLLQPQPLELVTMDAQKALKQRLAYEEGNLVSIALPEPADLNRKYAALSEPAEVMTDATVAPEPMSAKEGALLMADLEHDLHRLERYVTRSEEPVRVLITKRLGRERIRDVQLLLRELGYDPGPIDGFMGRMTGAAIQEYQEDNGLKATGAFSEELRDKLFLDARGEPAPTGHLYVRQGFKRVFDAPVTLKNPDEPLGTHVYLARSFSPTDAQTQWLSKVLRDRVERMLTPGSSMIVSDEGLGPETGRGTDFVVLN